MSNLTYFCPNFFILKILIDLTQEGLRTSSIWFIYLFFCMLVEQQNLNLVQFLKYQQQFCISLFYQEKKKRHKTDKILCLTPQ